MEDPSFDRPGVSEDRVGRERFSDDAFFVSIEAADPRFDPDATRRLLEGLGARRVELVRS